MLYRALWTAEVTDYDGPVSARALDEAIAWRLQLDGIAQDNVPPAALQHWLAADPEHTRAWRQLGGIDQQLSSIDTPAARRTLQHAAFAARRRGLHRTALVLALLGMLCIGLLRQSLPVQRWLADESTARGEQRSLSLPDYSRIHLNSRSALDIQFSPEERRLFLRSGEVLVETADNSDPRPFVVETDQGDLRALGTRFLVRREGESTRLTVLQSAVSAHPQASNEARIIQAGEQVLMHEDMLTATQPAPVAADAWRRGMLVVENMPLAELLDRLGEYRSGYLGLDSSLEGLRISGSFALYDTDLALAALPSSLPVRIERRTDWWVKVMPARE